MASSWVSFRDAVTTSLGIRDSGAAAKSLGNLTAQQIKAGARGGSSQTYVTPAAQSTATVRSTSSGDLLALGGGSFMVLAVIGVAAYFLLKR